MDKQQMGRYLAIAINALEGAEFELCGDGSLEHTDEFWYENNALFQCINQAAWKIDKAVEIVKGED